MNNLLKVYSPKNQGEFLNNIISIGYSIVNDEEHHVRKQYGDDNFLLIYIKKGEIILQEQTSGKTMHFGEGEIVLFAPHYKQNFKSLKGSNTEDYWVHFTGLSELLKQLDIFPNGYLSKNIGINEKIFSYWESIIKELQLSLYCSQIEANTRLVQILTLISREIYNKSNAKSSQIFSQLSPAIMEMNNHYNENHNNEFYANLCNMSESSFYHTFCKTFKTSPTKYINSIRIQMAENLLLETDMTIDNISICIGYTTPQYFSKIFKEKYKVSPLKFRQKNM